MGRGRRGGACLRGARRHPVGRSRVGDAGRRAGRARGRVRARRPCARHLLRHADDGRAARRPCRARCRARIRLRRGARPRPLGAAARHRGPCQRRGPRPARCLDEPRRPRRRAAFGLQVHRLHSRPAVRRHGRRDAPALRAAVPPRSYPHAPGDAHLRALPARHLRLRLELERRQHHRGCGRARARAGRWRQGAAGTLGRRGLLGRRGAAAQGDRRPAHLRVRGPRPVAPPRGRPGDGRVRAQPRRAGDPRGCRRALLCGARGRRGSRGQAQDHRAPVHRDFRRARPRSSRAWSSSRRARSTRT